MKPKSPDSKRNMTKHDQIFTKYNKILTKYDKHDQIHVGNFQERHFLEIKNPTPRITQDWGGWGGIGVLLIALLIANALTRPPYSTPLLKGVTQGSRGISFK